VSSNKKKTLSFSLFSLKNLSNVYEKFHEIPWNSMKFHEIFHGIP
jgi:hypothetical protein